MIEFQKLCREDDLLNGEMAGYHLQNLRVLLIKHANRFSAYVDECPHQGVPLSEGSLRDGVLVCYAHEWSFDAATGQGINPETSCLNALPVRIHEGDVLVGVAGREKQE